MSTENPKVPTASRRWRALAGVSAGLAALALAYGIYWGKVLRYHQSTDDAYVNGNVVQITPQISGTVVSIGADDTQFVKAGQPLVQLDQADAKVALDQAEAQLATTVREVRNLFATTRAARRRRSRMRQTDLDRGAERPRAPRAARRSRRGLRRGAAARARCGQGGAGGAAGRAAAARRQPGARRRHHARGSSRRA